MLMYALHVMVYSLALVFKHIICISKANKDFNALNVPPSDDAGTGKAAEVNKQILKGMRSFASNFSNLLTYFEERAVHVASMQPNGMSKSAADCCAALNGHAK